MAFGNNLALPTSVFVAATCLFICAPGWSQQSNSGANGGSAPAQNQRQSNGNQSGQTGSAKAAPPKQTSQGSNAFPLAQSEAAAKSDAERKAQQNRDGSPQNTPNTPAPSNPKKSATAKDNPFPEAQSQAAAKKDGQSGDQPSANPQSGASGPSGGYSSSNAHLPPPELGQGSLGSHEKMDTFTRDHTLDGRIQDDLNVADLYMKNGNYRGALLRYQDALQYDAQNDTALYGVANSMCKQNLTADAMAHFKSYAKNNPQGKYALKAEKMLAHPNKCTHNF